MQRTLFRRIAIISAGVYMLVCVGLFAGQRLLIYHPDKRDVAMDLNLLPGAVLVTFITADDQTIRGWYVPPRDALHPLYLYLPGNAETLANRAVRFSLLTQDGAGLLAVSWRGYGGSTGSPTEIGLHSDAVAAYQWLTAKVEARRIIVFGESVGTGVALTLAASRPVGALVLDAAYTSLRAVAQRRLPLFPVSWLMQDTFEVDSLAAGIRVPVLQRHCTGDPILPYDLARQLFASLGSANKSWQGIEGKCHLPGLSPSLPELRQLEKML